MSLHGASSALGQGEGLGAKQVWFGSDGRKEFFTVRVGRPWHRVPREAGAAPGSLALSQARLNGAWSSLGQREVSLPMAGVALGDP